MSAYRFTIEGIDGWELGMHLSVRYLFNRLPFILPKPGLGKGCPAKADEQTLIRSMKQTGVNFSIAFREDIREFIHNLSGH